jgi:hypothetical protein
MRKINRARAFARQVLSAVSLISLAGGGAPALAEGQEIEVAPARSLTGRIDMNVNHGNRLNRQAVVGKTDNGEGVAGASAVNKGTKPPLSGRLMDSGQAFPALSTQSGKEAPPSAGLAGAVDQAEPVKPLKNPYIWQMSKFGGYYDASGQMKGTVNGAELYKYGGFMGDEVTPVPKGPVKTNQFGHFEWHPSWMKQK